MMNNDFNEEIHKNFVSSINNLYKYFKNQNEEKIYLICKLILKIETGDYNYKFYDFFDVIQDIESQNKILRKSVIFRISML